MKSPADLPLEGSAGAAGGVGGGQMEKRLTWALNLAAFLHIIVSPYTKVIPLMFAVVFLGNCKNIASPV